MVFARLNFPESDVVQWPHFSITSAIFKAKDNRLECDEKEGRIKFRMLDGTIKNYDATTKFTPDILASFRTISENETAVTLGHLFKEIRVADHVLQGDESWADEPLSGHSIMFEITEPAGSISLKLEQLDRSLFFLRYSHPEFYKNLRVVGILCNGTRSEFDRAVDSLQSRQNTQVSLRIDIHTHIVIIIVVVLHSH
eukprot:c9862_g1_i4.p1 GENE.c9862_g1_i4~~c9862_g1_i4.p1  ORF type:complete len:197 (+),score=4.98 c9862_g1_i4:185-775(+)